MFCQTHRGSSAVHYWEIIVISAAVGDEQHKDAQKKSGEGNYQTQTWFCNQIERSPDLISCDTEWKAQNANYKLRVFAWNVNWPWDLYWKNHIVQPDPTWFFTRLQCCLIQLRLHLEQRKLNSNRNWSVLILTADKCGLSAIVNFLRVVHARIRNWVIVFNFLGNLIGPFSYTCSQRSSNRPCNQGMEGSNVVLQ